MKIVFVTGPAFSGKSIYIARYYPEAKVIDMRTFIDYAAAAESYEEMEQIAQNAFAYCRETLKANISAASPDDTIVLKDPMLERSSREYFLQGVHETTDAGAECVVLLPDETEVEKITSGNPTLKSLHEYEMMSLQMPEKEEGFSAVTVVSSILD